MMDIVAGVPLTFRWKWIQILSAYATKTGNFGIFPFAKINPCFVLHFILDDGHTAPTDKGPIEYVIAGLLLPRA